VAGANHDVLYTIGVLSVSKGPQVLHVPDMDGRYSSGEFVDPWGNPFYVCQRTTGTQAGDFSSHLLFQLRNLNSNEKRVKGL
jgi:hypothetical protein